MFSWYKYLIVNLVFSPPRFLEWESFSDCAFSRSLPTCTLLELSRQMRVTFRTIIQRFPVLLLLSLAISVQTESFFWREVSHGFTKVVQGTANHSVRYDNILIRWSRPVVANICSKN